MTINSTFQILETSELIVKRWRKDQNLPINIILKWNNHDWLDFIDVRGALVWTTHPVNIQDGTFVGLISIYDLKVQIW